MIKDWRRAWKFYSMWIFAFLIAFPDLYAEATALGLIQGGHIEDYFRVFGMMGLVLRVVGQGRPDEDDA